VLPSIENILSFSEENLLHFDTVQPVKMQSLDEVLERAASRSRTWGVDVNKIVTTLRDEEVHRQTTHWSWILGIVIIISSFEILWFVGFKLTNRYYPSKWESASRPEES
jgi:hypothetical protein